MKKLSLLVLTVAVLFSCKKSDSGVSSSNWTLHNITYSQDVNSTNYWDASKNSLLCYGIGSNNKPCTVEFEFGSKPTTSKIYNIDTSGNRPLDNSTCGIFAAAETSSTYFSYKKGDKANVTVSGNKIIIKVTNVAMKQDITYDVTSLSGTFIEQ
jgi:hypothetical protein